MKSPDSKKAIATDAFETRLDEALRAWPERPRDAMERDEFAARVQRRIASGDRGRTVAFIDDSKLFSSPLPSSEEEGHNSAAFGGPRESAASTQETGEKHAASAPPAPTGRASSTSDNSKVPPGAEGNKMASQSSERERDRKSLQDLARLASSSNLNPPSAPSSSSTADGSATKEDSGLIDLKAFAASDPNAVDRASVTPLASSGLFEDDTLSAPLSRPMSDPPAPRSVASGAPAIATPASSNVSGVGRPSSPSVAPFAPEAFTAQAAARADADKGEKKGRAGVLFGGVVVIAAMAAGAFFMLRPHPAQEPIVVSRAGSDVAPQAPAAPAVAATAAPVKTDTPAVAAAGDTVDPMALPKQGAPPAALAKGEAPKAGAAKANGKPEAPKAEEAKAGVDPKLVAKDLPSSPATTGALGDAMKQAAGPSTDSPAPAAAGPDAIQPGSVAQKPSQGAVTGALGAVLPAARACLGPDDPVSRAQVVFGSSGSVESVNVSGAAAGKPAEACIKGALAKAKVQPFAQPTYSATVTVRPN